MKTYFKSILLAVCLLATAFAGSAQSPLLSTASGNPLDTVTNTGVRIMGLNTVGYKETVTATIVITKISGAQGGTMVPVASDDGTNWHDISQISKDTVTVPNVASYIKGYNFQKGWKYYGVQWTGTGTMSGSISGKLVARKPTD